MITSLLKKVLPQQIARSEFCIPTPFVFHVITERQKRAIITDAISFTEGTIYNSTNFSPFEKHQNDSYATPLIREHHDFCLYCTQYKTFESSSADVPFTVLFSPAKNVNTGIFSKTTNLTDFYFSIQVVLVPFLKKMQEVIDFIEQPITVSSVVDELRTTQRLLEMSGVDKVGTFENRHHWLLRDIDHINAFQSTIFPEKKFCDTVTTPQIKPYSQNFLAIFFSTHLEQLRSKLF